MLARSAAPCRAAAAPRAAPRPVAVAPRTTAVPPRRSFASAAASGRASATPARTAAPRAYYHSEARAAQNVTAPAEFMQANFGIAGAALLLGAAAYVLADNDKAEAAEAAFTGTFGTDGERTFIAIKPDGVQRGLIGEIIQRFEKKGYKLVACKVVQPTEAFARQHYSDLAQKPFFPSLVKYFSSGPVVAMVWEGKNVIVNGRKIIGATNPANAEPGSIRGDLCIETGRNIVRPQCRA